MNPKVCLSVVLALCAMNMVSAQFATAIGAAIVAKAIWVKGIAIAAIAGGAGAGVGSGFFGGRPSGGYGHGKRSADETSAVEEAAFSLLAAQESQEPQQCFRRLICSLATGSVKPSQFDVIPKYLTRKQVGVESPEFEYANAAKLGAKAKNIHSCELRYSCPLTSEEIASLF